MRSISRERCRCISRHYLERRNWHLRRVIVETLGFSHSRPICILRY